LYEAFRLGKGVHGRLNEDEEFIVLFEGGTGVMDENEKQLEDFESDFSNDDGKGCKKEWWW
jgi:hypothetical protein